MADQTKGKSSKGNPAAHRMSNTHRKERRAVSWRQGQARKRRNIAINEAYAAEKAAHGGLGRRERRRIGLAEQIPLSLQVFV
jgi:hypothetical protein